MTKNETEIIGKDVKDMYGTFMGRVVGTMTEVDGTIQSVGVDCGSGGLQQIRHEQMVVREDVVIFIPRWRLDSQKLIREKQLTLRRLRALMDIVSENDGMKTDAEIIHDKYRSRLATLDETEEGIKAVLDTRAAELEEELKSAKMLVFDAKLQSKSNEITLAAFETVRARSAAVIERINSEKSEIADVKGRIADLGLEAESAEPRRVQEPPVVAGSGSHAAVQVAEVPPPPAPEGEAPVFPEPPSSGGDWLSRMESQ
ncbi:MAG: CdvA-like protein [Nitrosopumilus sp.]|nr:CdvA-like protein [Nitrosopumilus sp.]CAI9831533.1 conserved hypothetical protein [Nitrosopumilaceae archaeon]MDA7940816.1 CdvA-like protein [Nitrosopumilus sp.]MDA7943024.1 CdvA-like protein [Nitrosopumilus sp.]MDA7944565.1 CdvA-like protein [Nitrosopumilus sp.]